MKAPLISEPSGRPIAMARAADPDTSRLVDVSVRGREFVAALAVGLPRSLSEWACSTVDDVHALRNRFDVLGVHAAGISAEMIGHEASWERAPQQFIGDVMGDAIPAVPLQMAIAERELRSYPDPAALGLSYFGPKCRDGLVRRHRPSAAATRRVAAPQRVSWQDSLGAAFAAAAPQGLPQAAAPDIFDGREAPENLAAHVDGAWWQIHGVSQC